MKKKSIVEFFWYAEGGNRPAGTITYDNGKLEFSKDFPAGIKEDLELGMALGDKMWSVADGMELLKRLPYIYSGSRFWAEKPRKVD